MPQPTIVLVHGFWGDAAHWADVILGLDARGHQGLRAVELPLTGLADDAERTRKAVRQIDGPVLLVGHSYGGAVITEAGHEPNVAGLVYVAAFAPDEGESLAGLSQEAPPAAFENITPDSDGYLWVRPDKFHESFCPDLPADRALVMAVTQKAPLASTFGDIAGKPAWRDVPSWYQLSTEDRMVSPELQRRMADRLNARTILELAASHASLASQPEAIAGLIDDAARSLAG